MKELTKEELSEVLELHKKWLNNEEGGERANLSYTNLGDADLTNVKLRSADLSCADLTFADLSGADLTFADLSGANLSYADLSYADLAGANLCYAKLARANLRNADLSYADLFSTNLTYANLTDANLTGASLNSANTQKVKGLEIMSIDNIGTFNGKVTFVPSLDEVFAGCWRGSLEGFLKQGLEMNDGDEVQCSNIRLAYELFKNNACCSEIK